MTLIICVKTYKKFGLEAKIGVGTLVCLIYIQNVNSLIPVLHQDYKTGTLTRMRKFVIVTLLIWVNVLINGLMEQFLQGILTIRYLLKENTLFIF